MYDRAYQICEDPQLLKPYLYASYKYMSLEEYHILLTKHEEYLEINAKMRQEMDDIRKNLQVEPNQQLVEKWKRRHRRSHTLWYGFFQRYHRKAAGRTARSRTRDRRTGKRLFDIRIRLC